MERKKKEDPVVCWALFCCVPGAKTQRQINFDLCSQEIYHIINKWDELKMIIWHV